MDFEFAFTLVNLTVMPAWLLLIFAPNWKFTQKIVHAVFIPLIMVLAYIYFIGWALFFGGGSEGGGFGSLQATMLAFDSPITTLGGWVHYLVFDLFVGMWIARDGKRRGFHHGWLIPCLLFTYLFGPVGLGLYLLIRLVTKKGGLRLDEQISA
jgi:hypothetical protein